MAKKKSGMKFHEAVEWMTRNQNQKLTVSGHSRYKAVCYVEDSIQASPGYQGLGDEDCYEDLSVYGEFRSCLFSVPEAIKPLSADLETIISKFGCQAANVRELVGYLQQPKRTPAKKRAAKKTAAAK